MEINERKNLPIKKAVHKRIKAAANEADVSMQDYVERIFESFQFGGREQNPNHALLDLALSRSTPEQQRSILAGLEATAGIMPKGKNESATARVETESPFIVGAKTDQAKRAKKSS